VLQVFKISDVFDNLDLRPGLQEHLLLHRDEYMVIDGDSKGKDSASTSGATRGGGLARHQQQQQQPVLSLDEGWGAEDVGLERTDSYRSDNSHIL
jgi:hypothetical protein